MEQFILSTEANQPQFIEEVKRLMLDEGNYQFVSEGLEPQSFVKFYAPDLEHLKVFLRELQKALPKLSVSVSFIPEVVRLVERKPSCAGCGAEFGDVYKQYQATDYCEICAPLHIQWAALQDEFNRMVYSWKIKREISDMEFEDFLHMAEHDAKEQGYPVTLEDLEKLEKWQAFG